ncbi:iron-containing alcohol dehydrogenase [Enterococcus thailandicus]|uniref:iron-containing alcohol dehydrogenase n=1 Tax=Enterococcus thailandicus TaxID=417368 RepID=UPI0022EBBC0B|nr:iron-containing alcohol dehydrogenase [Enterococcus thailandicus]MDA3974063.1 iron-containing alcohol dehydrogenase [Enterococcus thailandicus]MDA3976775.1 iron-containing alcohol dehydrogenase [Enterococcus thailandicus]MDA3981517.1 iron-containing alcohol dehydrogenase [Enterococcus thailandicus]
MKTNYDFMMPSVNFFGPGVIAKIGERAKLLGMNNILIVTDSFLHHLEDGPVKQTEESLRLAGISYAIFDGVEPNPKIRNVQAGAAMYQENNCDSIITVGGGSAHDCGKGIGIALTNGEDLAKLAGIETLIQPLPPLMAVNTTAGTASEITRHAVLTNEDTHLKFVIVSWRNVPLVSFNDPLLMLDVPSKLTAATGMDALCHCVESYVSENRNPITDAQAIQGMKLIGQYLRRAVANGHDVEARTNMAYASLLAGMAFNNADLGYVHAMAHQLGGQYDAPHGVCCAVLMPTVERWNMIASPERFADIATFLGENITGLSPMEAAEKGIHALERISEDVGIPTNIKSIGADPKDFELMAENALKDGNAFSNPRKGTKSDIVELFTRSYEA